MKTNKHQTLLLVGQRSAIHARDLVERSGYSPGTARSYLSHLGRQGLLERQAGRHVLTEKGRDRLQFFEVSGCADPVCPRCQGKAGYLSCPSCGHRVPSRSARILKKRDFFLVVRHSGVYCARCAAPILSEAQARLFGISEED